MNHTRIRKKMESLCHTSFMIWIFLCSHFYIPQLCILLLVSFCAEMKWSYHSNATWVSWRFKSPETWLFVRQLVYAHIKENLEVPHYWPFVRGIQPWQRAVNGESVSILGRNHTPHCHSVIPGFVCKGLIVTCFHLRHIIRALNHNNALMCEHFIRSFKGPGTKDSRCFPAKALRALNLAFSSGMIGKQWQRYTQWLPKSVANIGSYFCY